MLQWFFRFKHFPHFNKGWGGGKHRRPAIFLKEESLLCEDPPQKGDDLPPRAGYVGRDCNPRGSLSNSLLQHSVHRVRTDVRKVGGKGLGAAGNRAISKVRISIMLMALFVIML